MISLGRAVELLRKTHGAPPPPRWTDPFEVMLAENASYLVDDERRAQVFEALAAKVGTTPEAILAVTPKALANVIAAGGMRPPMRAEKLRKAAVLAQKVGLDGLRESMRTAPDEARKQLKKFPGIGEPGADKLLLLAQSVRSLAPDSNVLRVLTRLGFAREQASYDKTYRAVNAAVSKQLPAGYDALIEARELLRRHGQTTCKRTSPACAECPLASQCKYAASKRRR